MTVTLMESSSKPENEEQIFIDTILEIFGTVENAKGVYKDYQHVCKAMRDADDVTLTVSQITNYERWADARKGAEAAAFADRQGTDAEYFQVEFND